MLISHHVKTKDVDTYVMFLATRIMQQLTTLWVAEDNFRYAYKIKAQAHDSSELDEYWYRQHSTFGSDRLQVGPAAAWILDAVAKNAVQQEMIQYRVFVCGALLPKLP